MRRVCLAAILAVAVAGCISQARGPDVADPPPTSPEATPDADGLALDPLEAGPDGALDTVEDAGGAATDASGAAADDDAAGAPGDGDLTGTDDPDGNAPDSDAEEDPADEDPGEADAGDEDPDDAGEGGSTPPAAGPPGERAGTDIPADEEAREAAGHVWDVADERYRDGYPLGNVRT